MTSWSAASSVTVVAVIFLRLVDALHQVPEPNVALEGSRCLNEASAVPNRQSCPVEVADEKFNLPAPRRPRPHLKYYLHEHDDLFQSVTDCFLKETGISLSHDDWDDHLRPVDAEHLGELWMLKKLQSHRQRTHNMAEADVNIVAVSAFASLRAGQAGYCGDSVRNHRNRMSTLSERIGNSDVFRRRGHTFFISSTYYGVPPLFTHEFLERWLVHNASVGTGDQNYLFWARYRSLRKVVVPYKAHYLADTREITRLSDRISDRTTDLLFRGCVNRLGSGGDDRNWILNLGKFFRKSDIKDVCIFEDDERGQVISRETSNLYKTSRFCLVPSGDSPTSRRLFDALASGCVPVYVGWTALMEHNLPFARTIDWSEVILFGGSDTCGDLSILADWLKPILRNETLWQMMSNKGREVYHKYLSYTKGDEFVTAMLDEIVVD